MLTLFEVYQTIETLSIPRNIHLKLAPHKIGLFNALIHGKSRIWRELKKKVLDLRPGSF